MTMLTGRFFLRGSHKALEFSQSLGILKRTGSIFGSWCVLSAHGFAASPGAPPTPSDLAPRLAGRVRQVRGPLADQVSPYWQARVLSHAPGSRAERSGNKCKVSAQPRT